MGGRCEHKVRVVVDLDSTPADIRAERKRHVEVCRLCGASWRKERKVHLSMRERNEATFEAMRHE
jgi:hypothetical protein